MAEGKILIVDDEQTILDACTMVLSRQGYQVHGATSPERALDLAIKEPFDLLLTDVMMPVMSGIELLRTVKHLYPELVGVMITGHANMETAIESLRAGAQGFVMKPFNATELRLTVEEALGKGRLLKENVRLKALMPLFEVSKNYHQETNPERLLKLVVESVAKAVQADHVMLSAPPEGQESTAPFSSVATFPEAAGARPLRLDPKVVEWVTATREPLLLPSNVLKDNPVLFRPDAAKGVLLHVPLQANGVVLGIMSLQKNGEGQAFSESEMEVIHIQASQAAVAMENALLFRSLEESYLSALASLANALEARDISTQGHCQRLSQLSVAVAGALGVNGPELEAIRVGSLLHDIGKIGVPDSILLKNGSLTEEEFEVIKKHPLIGAQIVAPIRRLSAAAPIIKHHHEKYDGTGYPDGLQGTAIPAGARIVAACDAFDVMTEQRRYRNAISALDGLRELQRCRATQFDPEVVDAFFELLQTPQRLE